MEDVDMSSSPVEESEMGGEDEWAEEGDLQEGEWSDEEVPKEKKVKSVKQGKKQKKDITSSSSSSSKKVVVDEEEIEDGSKDEKEGLVMTRPVTYEILEDKSLYAKQDGLIAKVAEVLYVTNAEAGSLLRHYGWKANKLEQDWFSNQRKVRQEAGLTPAPEGDKKREAAIKKGTIQCETAYCENVPIDQAAALNCGHWFCNDCWTGFLTSQLNSATAVFSRCMGMRCRLTHNHNGCSCNEMVPVEMFAKFVQNPELIAKYQRWLLMSFVEGQPLIKWCPSPTCSFAVSLSASAITQQDIICKCKHRFCFSCAETAHCPAPCDLVKKWQFKEQSDDATAIWLAARTKECPKCKVRIEKNKACNHMTCTKCGFHFCWLCKEPWDKHGTTSGGFYVCNQYNASVAKGTRSAEEKKLIDTTLILQKYTYYYQRWKSSIEGIKLTQKLGQTIENVTTTQDIHKIAFLQEAVAKLVEARRVLQWSYVLSYYMKAGLQKDLFEYQQQMLCGKTEALTHIMENSERKIGDLLSKRREIQDLTALISKFRLEMVKLVEGEKFQEALLQEADTVMELWACSYCRIENKKESAWCIACKACKVHGELDCKACPGHKLH